MEPRAFLAALPALAAVAAVALAGCSSAPAPAPAGGADTCKANGAAYAKGPCGTDAPLPIANYAFTGRLAGIDSPITTFHLADYYNPDGAKPYKYLFVTVSAFWCGGCKEEAKQLNTMKDTYGPKGVFIMTDLAQKLDQQPSDQNDLDVWIKSYALQTAVVNDPDFALSRFFDVAQMPLNLVVDLKTMVILKKFVGADLPAVLAYLDTITK